MEGNERREDQEEVLQRHQDKELASPAPATSGQDGKPDGADQSESGEDPAFAPEAEPGETPPGLNSAQDEKVEHSHDMRLVRFAVADLKIRAEALRRTKPDPLADRELADSLKRNGQLTPIVVTGDNEVVFGTRRLRIAKAMKWKTLQGISLDRNVPADVAEWDEEHTKEPIHILDKSWRIRSYRKEGMTEEEIGKRIGLKQSMISHLDKLNEMNAEERKLYLEKKIATRPMIDLLRADEKTRKQAVARAKAGKSVTQRGIANKFKFAVIPKVALHDGMFRGRVTKGHLEIVIQIPMKSSRNTALDTAKKFLTDNWGRVWKAARDAKKQL